MHDFLMILGVWGAALVSVVAAVRSAYYARKNLGRELRDDVDELVATVGSLGKITRSVQMQRVRATATAPAPPAGPVEPGQADRHAVKSELRARLASARNNR